MYDIAYTRKAVEDLNSFSKNEQNRIISAIDTQLRYEPTIETRNRKHMRPNRVAEWELRSGPFRVLYDVDERVQIVEIQRIGEKRGSNIYFRGRREDLS